MSKASDLAKLLLDVLPSSMHQIRLEMRSVKPADLSVPQFRIVGSIFRGRNQPSEIAKHQGVSLPAMSKMINVLVKRGLVDRSTHTRDRRQIELKLTKEGETLYREVRSRTQSKLSKKMVGLNADERSQLERGLWQLKKIFLVFVVSLIAFQPLMGMAADTLSWDDCLREVVIANPDLHVAASNLKAAQNQVKGAWSGFFPQISGNLGYSRGSSSSNFSTVTGSIPSSTTGGSGDNFYSASVSASENLFSGFSDRAKVKSAKANREVASVAVLAARSQASYNLKSSFASLLYAQSALKLTEDIIRRREDNLNMIRLRYENGSENKGSLLLSQAYLEQAKYDELQAKDGIKVSRQQLAKVLGRNDTSDIHIAGKVPIAPPPSNADVKKLAAESPSLLTAMAQKKAAKAAVTAARSPFFPSLNVTATAGKQGSDWPPDNGRWSVGTNLAIPFFNGGRDYYATKSATASLEAATYTEESVSLQTETQLEQALTGFVEAAQKLKSDQSFLDASTVREEIARRQYENGLISFQDWDLIETDLITRQKQVLQSELNRIVSEATWEQAQGKGVFE